MSTLKTINLQHPTGSNTNLVLSNTSSVTVSNTLTVTSNTMTVGTSAYFVANGNLGIGTTSPSAGLHVRTSTRSISCAADGAGQGGASYFIMGNSDSGGTSGPNVIFAANRSLSFGVGNSFTAADGGTFTEYARIDSSGNVGIGLTSPDSRLHVKGAGTTFAQLRIGYNGTSDNYYDGNTHYFRSGSGNSNYVTFDSSGNVGIGTTSPSDKLNIVTSSVNAGVTVSGSTDPQYYLSSSGGNTARFKINDTSAMVQIGSWSNIATGFYTNGSERARFDSSGSFWWNTTSSRPHLATGTATAGFQVSTQYGMEVNNKDALAGIFNRTNSTGAVVELKYNATVVGNISVGTSTTSYNTSSDYRLKNSISNFTNGLSTIGLLRPVKYKWNTDGSDGEGFLAHELQEVIPLAVIGQKDAVDEEGNIKPQGVDYSKIVVHLVAAIQELKTQNDALAARVTELENK